ncbi:MAG: pyrroloquinoline quinone-dependent dehydrogenase [Gammaproteobacteria bacterium]|nr:pyrroloquinoline quinone-dependent dehydrogenase [Gammaproteobacteria bacterium]
MKPGKLTKYSIGFGLAVSSFIAISVSEEMPALLLTAFADSSMSADWPTSDGLQGTHYSPLADINRDNVTTLELAWTYRTGDVNDGQDGLVGTAFEATPLMVDATLFIPTPYSRVIALNAETGEELWAFDANIDRSDPSHIMAATRGVSTWLDESRKSGQPCQRRIFLAAFDAYLFALDSKTGALCTDFGNHGRIDLGDGVARLQGKRHLYKQTAPPAIVNDLVIVGSKIIDSQVVASPSGVVRAFDTRNGQLRWSWEPLTGVSGINDDGAEIPAGAANTWATMTVDEERDLIFVPTGSASPDHWGGLREGKNLYANSLVALRASTGEVVWHYQIVHHDLWDYDLASPPALITISRGGESIPAVVQGTKMGYLYFLHRDTGEPLFPVIEQPVPASDMPGEFAWPTQPVPLLPRPLGPEGLSPDDAWGLTPIDRSICRKKIISLRHDGIFAPPSLQGTIVFPGFLGGNSWGGIAYDPVGEVIVTNTNRIATVLTLIPRNQLAMAATSIDDQSAIAEQAPAQYGVRRSVLLSPLGVPCSPPPWGMLHAIDARTGELRWEIPLGTMRDLVGLPSPAPWGSPNLGGAIISGGLVFIAATMDRRIRAFDLASGQLVWEETLPASAQATPMTYRTRPGGRQFLVIAAGGHALMHSSLGDYVVAYALPASGEDQL